MGESRSSGYTLVTMPHSTGERVATQLPSSSDSAKENMKSTVRVCVFVVVLLTGLITGKDAFLTGDGQE